VPARTALSAQHPWVELPQGPSTTNGYPQDCAASSDYRRAAVRFADPASNDAVVSVFQLNGSGLPVGSLHTFGGGTLLSGEQINVFSGSGYKPSDRVEVTNEWGVSIGTGISSLGFSSDETYIEVFDVDTPAAGDLVQFVITPTLGDYNTDRAGNTHDLAITRDAKWAVVNSQNWIHLLRLIDSTTTPPTVTYTGFNIGANVAGPCDPNAAVDSVAVTNERAVVTTSRPSEALFGLPVTWVYIIDLTPVTGPVIVLEHELAPPVDFEPDDESDDERPHDVAITPTRDGGGTLAVVTTNHATAFYDLVTNSFVKSDFNRDYRRRYQVQVDSVELTGKTAVTIADLVGGAATKWAVRIYDLTPPTFPIVADYQDPLPPEGGSRAHDLAIDWDFDKGLVRTSFSNVVITSLTSPPPTGQVVSSPNNSDAYAFESFRNGTGESVFSSDSVALGIEQNGGLFGVTIGGTTDAFGIYRGYVDIIDLGVTPPVVNQIAILPDVADTFVGCVPLDLAIAFNQTDVVVRSADGWSQAAGFVGPDLTQIDLATGAVLKSWGGNGICGATDALAVPSLSGFVNTARRIFSVSQRSLTFGGLPNFPHFAR
jgi:hypothetical protein